MSKKAGGKIYEQMAKNVLKDFNVKIKNFDESLFFDKKKKNIAIIHHLDYSQASLLIRIIYFFIKPIILRNFRKFDAIVVVSKYWKHYFESKGYKNVHLIYNAFNLDDFNFSDEEIKEFKQKYNLTKPIIYLGNCQKSKGVVEAYEALKELNVHFITSGRQQVKIPALHLDLNYRDYLRLLKASDIVLTMSKFEEGFCRTTAEAMLCRTPVIGSGEGGMKELLAQGGQMICDFNNLKETVELVLTHPEGNIGEYGYEFAKDFTLERFEKDWINLIKKL